MTESPPKTSPAVALDNLEPTQSFNSEPIAKEEPSEPMDIPPPSTTLPSQQLDTEMTDVAVGFRLLYPHLLMLMVL